MGESSSKRFGILISVVTLIATNSGCRTGPLAEYGYLNPWIRAEWETDEAIAPTLHKQLAELSSIRSRAHRMSESEQQHFVEILLPLLEEAENPPLRLAVADTLGFLHTGPSFEALKQVLQDPEDEVRIAAVRSLAQHPPEYAIPVLSAALAGDTEHDVRIELIRQLGQFSDPMAVRAVATALDDQDPAIQYVAVRSLENATDADVGNNVPAWREYLHQNYGIASGPDEAMPR